MAQDPVRMPREVDEPPVLMMWSADELVVFSAFFITGFMIEQVLVLSVVGLLAVRTLRRFRNTRQRGAMVHQLYWWGLWPNRAPTVGNPFERDHIG